MLLRDLPDPERRYEIIKKNAAYHGFEMVFPPVFDGDGNHILPGDYKTTIPEGSIVTVRGTMKM